MSCEVWTIPSGHECSPYHKCEFMYMCAGSSSGAGHHQPEASAGEAHRHHCTWTNALVPRIDHTRRVWAQASKWLPHQWKIPVSIITCQSAVFINHNPTLTCSSVSPTFRVKVVSQLKFKCKVKRKKSICFSSINIMIFLRASTSPFLFDFTFETSSTFT